MTFQSAPLSVDLSTGRLQMFPRRAVFEPVELLRVAERENPKRAFLFVSTVLGRHIPVAPRRHLHVVRRLALEIERALAGLAPKAPVFAVSFAETAVGLGALVCRELRRTGRRVHHLPTTRHPGDFSVWARIREEHSHAPDHALLEPSPEALDLGRGAPCPPVLLLIDDEITTGATMAAAAREIAARLEISGIVCASFADWSDESAVEICGTAAQAPAVSASLLVGSCRWRPRPGAVAPRLPEAAPVAAAPWAPRRDADPLHAAPRFGGFDDPPLDLAGLEGAGLAPPRPGERVLVIGMGEHAWTPFRLAEAFAARGALSAFCAVSRSPIRRGGPIRDKASFPDPYGLGLTFHLHNVDPRDWDRIVMMTETEAEAVHPFLCRALSDGVLVDGRGRVRRMEEMA